MEFSFCKFKELSDLFYINSYIVFLGMNKRIIRILIFSENLGNHGNHKTDYHVTFSEKWVIFQFKIRKCMIRETNIDLM